MAIYIDRRELPEDLNAIPDGVLQFVLDEHRTAKVRLDMLHAAYMGKNFPKMTEDDDISLVVDYPRYITDTITGFYLGDPVKYNAIEETGINPGTKATVRGGEVVRADKISMPEADIKPITDIYKKQSIADVDTEIGRDLGEYGEAYELAYASDDETPIPKSAVCSPRSSVMVRDTSVDHHRLFFLTYERRKRTDKSLYYAVFVYTPTECIEYHSDGVDSPMGFHEIGRTPHYFGEVPAVEYRNNADRLGDYETSMSLINAYNKLMSDRVTDKARFIDAVLFLYGMALTEEQRADLKKYGLVDQLPSKSEGASAEYVQKLLDESGAHILAEDIVHEIHKQSLTVDMTDVSFGTSSGQAMKLKLMTMTMLIKNKIRSMERGLKKRFELYNKWLAVQGTMPIIDRDQVDVVFSIQMPIDETGIVSIVTALQGIVDNETLLGLLWFVKDPQATIEKVKQQRQEQQQEYFDTFGMMQKENTIHAENAEDNGESRDTDEQADTEGNRPAEQVRPADNRNKNGRNNKAVRP